MGETQARVLSIISLNPGLMGKPLSALTPLERLDITTAHVAHEQLQQLSDEVGPDHTLLV